MNNMNIISGYNPNFQANLNSPKLRFERDDFFVRIQGYGKNKKWADSIIKTADLAANLIRRNTSAENVLKIITAGVRRANQFPCDIKKREYTGIIRTNREGWQNSNLTEIYTPYDCGKYYCYSDILDLMEEHPLKNPLKIGLSRPGGWHEIKHGDYTLINKALNHVFKLSQTIFPKFIHKDVKPHDLNKINSTIAEIRWVLAHSTPWMRGSDAISNVLVRAIYKSIGIKTYPLKHGISLDLEAYCTELSDYKKRFPSYFEKPPEIIEG